MWAQENTVACLEDTEQPLTVLEMHSKNTPPSVRKASSLRQEADKTRGFQARRKHGLSLVSHHPQGHPHLPLPGTPIRHAHRALRSRGLFERRSPALLRREYRFASGRPTRAVNPNPGVSCAIATAPSSRDKPLITGDQDEEEAPKPWFMWRTHRGSASPSFLGSSRRQCTFSPSTSSKWLLGKDTLSAGLSFG